jgi:DNA-binding response OmpR family regulator
MAKALVLVVEDDADIAALIVRYLAQAGYDSEIIASGGDVLPRVRERLPDLIVLDLMLPQVSGLDLCRALRANPHTASIPIVIVTARGDESDRIVGLEIGADDYVTKPFSPNELLARIAAVLRRTQRPADSSRVLRQGTVTVDLDSHTVTDAEREVHLTAKEFLLLQLMIERRGHVLSRDQLLSQIWGYQYTGGSRTVDVHIRRLREKLPSLARDIVTIKQFGYKLRPATS